MFMFLCDLWLITNHRRQLQLPSQGPEFGSGKISLMHDFKQLKEIPRQTIATEKTTLSS